MARPLTVSRHARELIVLLGFLLVIAIEYAYIFNPNESGDIRVRVYYGRWLERLLEIVLVVLLFRMGFEGELHRIAEKERTISAVVGLLWFVLIAGFGVFLLGYLYLSFFPTFGSAVGGAALFAFLIWVAVQTGRARRSL